MADPRGAKPRFFDLWSYVYDAPWVQRLTYRPLHDAVLAALPETRQPRVLDVGCGTGQLCNRLRHALPGAPIVGCDFSGGMLRHAAARSPGSARIGWVRSDAQALPFRDGSFDVLVSTEAFHWFPDQQRALAEFYRVLAPEGRLLLALMNAPVEWLTRMGHAGSQLLGEPAIWPTRQRLREQAEHAGFRVERQSRVYRIPLGVTLPPTLMLAVRPSAPLARSR